MEFRILGPLEILDDRGAPVAFGGGRERALLVRLLLSANQVVSVEALARDLWGDCPPEGAAHALHVHISRLRKALREAAGEGLVITRPPGYLVRVDAAALDALQFEALVAEAREQAAGGDHLQAAVTLRRGLSLWRGPALADVADSRLARTEAARLEEARLAALEERVEADLACGRHGELVAELDALTQAHPLRERLWGQRMVALYRAGRQAEALRAYQELRKILRDELGLDPSPSLQRIEGAILRHEADLDVREVALALQGPTPSPIPMPTLLTDIGRVFVGREAQLAQLDALWAAVTAGAAGPRRLALLSGEPGVGKTRLAAEFARRVHGDGFTVLAGRCDEDLGVPYQPFVEALHHYVEGSSSLQLNRGLGAHSGELVRIHPDLSRRVPGLAPPMRSDPDTERYRLFEAVAGWLAAASSDQPILLLLDDLHWATKPTLLLLRQVVRSPEAMKVLVVGAYRDTEVGQTHPLVEMLADFRRDDAVERLPLAGLEQADVAHFMAEVARRELDDDGLSLARIIHSQTEGNPFFVREVIRHLTETGELERQQGRWGTRLPIDELGVPEGVREVVGRRLAHLSGETNDVLRVAAVVGAEFEPAVVREASDLKDDTVLCALEEAIAARLVVESPGPASRHRFAHAIVRDTLYGRLSAARRMTIHRRVAQAIETLHGAIDDQLPSLAHHWARAAASGAETARAVDYATRAGDRALFQLAHDEAARYYASGLNLLDAAGAGANDSRRLELLIRCGEAQRRAADPAFRQTLLDAATLARRLGDAHALARAAAANTVGHMWTNAFVVDVDRIEVLEAAISALGEADLRLRARLLATLGLETGWEPYHRRRVGLSDEALRIARSLDDPETLAHVLLARDYTMTAPDNAEERLVATSELLTISERLGDPVLSSRALSLRFKVAMELGDVAEAERSLTRNRELVADLGQRGLTWATLHHQATLAVLRGEPELDAAVCAAAELGRAIGQPEIFTWANQMTLYFDRAPISQVEPWIRQTAERTSSPFAKAAYGHLLAVTDRVDAAGAVFDDLAATDFAHPTHNAAWLACMTESSWLCAFLGRDDCVPRLRSTLVPYAGQLVVTGFAGWVAGSVAFYLGLLATTERDWSTAETQFAAAAATHEHIGAAAWLARTRLEWARMLVARRQPGDAEQAGALLGQAAATARELGLAKLETETGELSGQK